MKNPLGKNSAFTIVELLITIGILIILASSVVVYLNPGERLAEGRDSRRTNELNQISAALRLVYTQGKIKGNTNTVYLSLPDSSTTCGSYSLPQLPSGWTYACASSSTYLNVDGTGWIPVNFNTIPGGSTLSSIPIDPRNTQDFYYAYVVDPTDSTYDVTALMESEKHIKLAAKKDNGTDRGRYEVGSNLSLWTSASGLKGYWPLDEGIGTTTADLSGNNHTGTLYNSPAWATSASCKSDNCISFDGVNDYVGIGIGSDYFPLTRFSICAWEKTPGLAAGMSLNGIISLTYGLTLSLNNSGQVFTRVDNGTSIIALSDLSNLYDNKFHHVCMNFDGVNRNIYVDGVLTKTGATTWSGTSLWPTNTCNIGHENNNSSVYKFNGQIDEVRVYNRALSASEILAIYKADK